MIKLMRMWFACLVLFPAIAMGQPDRATTPSPKDNQLNVGVDTLLTWTPASGAASHDVYFGTDPSPDSSELLSDDQTVIFFDPGTLNYNTVYYWRVDEVNSAGTTQGHLWTFTTLAQPSTTTTLTSPVITDPNVIDPNLRGTVTVTDANAFTVRGKYGAALVDGMSHFTVTIIDPNGAYDSNTVLEIADFDASAYPAGFKGEKIKVSYNKNPSTELDANLIYADDFITLANPVTVAAVDTTDGLFSEDDPDNINGGAAIPSGKSLYLAFDADPVVTSHLVISIYGRKIQPVDTGVTYYVDNTGGSDSNTGLSTGAAWETISKANSTLTPGDTVYIRAGTYNETIQPTNSGEAGKPITYESYQSETVTITGVANAADIQLKQYIVIDGMTVSSTTNTWIDMDGADYCTIQNCTLNGSDTGNGFSMVGGADYNKIIGNTMKGQLDGGGLWKPFDFLYIRNGSDHNLIEDNTFKDPGHAAVFAFTDCHYTVIRNNRSLGSFSTSFQVIDSDYSVMEDNFVVDNTFNGAETPSALRFNSRYGICRRNIVVNCGGAFTGGSYYYGGNANIFTDCRIYSNIFYNNGYGIFINVSAGDLSMTNNHWRNNIIYENDTLEIYFDATSDYAIENDWSYNDITPGSSNYQFNTYTTTQLESTFPSRFYENFQVDPNFVDDSDVNDVNNFDWDATQLMLTLDSPLKNAGGWLTTCVGNSTGTTLTVADAYWFYDGRGISGEVGDTIQLQGQTDTATITSIDYGYNKLSLSEPLIWTDGLGVALAYKGSGPDVGVYETLEFTRYQYIDVNSVLVGTGGVTDFSLLLTREAFHDNVVDPSGSSAAQSDGGDLRFYTDSTLTTELASDIVSFELDSSTGAGDADIEIYVMVSSLADSGDPNIVVAYNTPTTDSHPISADDYGSDNAFDVNGVMFLTFSEDPSTTNAEDITSHNNDAMPIRMASSALISAKVGQGWQFDGSDDYATIANHETINFADEPFSYAFWLKAALADPNDNERFIMKGTSFGDCDGKRYEIVWQAAGPTLAFVLDDDVAKTEDDRTGGDFIDGTWHHLAYTRDPSNNQIKIYLDGSQTGSTETDASGDVSQACDLWIAGNHDDAVAFMKFAMDSFRMYDDVLTAAEITTIYNMENNPSGMTSTQTPVSRTE